MAGSGGVRSKKASKRLSISGDGNIEDISRRKSTPSLMEGEEGKKGEVGVVKTFEFRRETGGRSRSGEAFKVNVWFREVRCQEAKKE